MTSIRRSAIAVSARLSRATLFLLLGFNTLVVSRFDHYFWAVVPILIARVVEPREAARVFGYVFICLGVVYYVAYIVGFGGLLPYRSVFGAAS